MARLGGLLDQAERVLGRLEQTLAPGLATPDWEAASAFRWRRRGSQAWLQPVPQPAVMRFTDLQGIDEQKARLERNTRQFVAGRPANNVLLTGARGTGKSSLVKACLHAFASKGLRLIEMDKADLVDLPELVDMVRGRRERFIVFSDDLSFDQGEPGYKALKSVLDGSVAGTADNLLIYATSNRRHLLPEYMHENLEATHSESGEVHPGEGTEEKVSLSDRFGLWLSFYPFDQEHYLRIAEHWLQVFGLSEQQARAAHAEALLWALERGSRSGRIAWQFARDYCGRRRK
ncbi:ATP-binding protein [Thiomonas sp.]|uniref:ATP-binding protein n=1 Tax=Thiomonas sp. TaxID=2047785 RepID=UPI0026378E94|nr:ATP-binding protein [Thiomonas sp.]